MDQSHGPVGGDGFDCLEQACLVDEVVFDKLTDVDADLVLTNTMLSLWSRRRIRKQFLAQLDELRAPASGEPTKETDLDL